ncbi:hypothetical protein LG275_09930 [Chryseomicrobium palamuruense]
MKQIILGLIIIGILSGCGTQLSLTDSNSFSDSSSVLQGDYTFTLTVIEDKDSDSIISAELGYEGEEENVLLRHANEIYSYEVLDEDKRIIFSNQPTEESNETILRNGENLDSDLNLSLSDLPSPGKYKVIVIANFTDTITTEVNIIENTISFEVE